MKKKCDTATNNRREMNDIETAGKGKKSDQN